MFKKEYQGGSHVEVFSAQGRDPVSHWKLTGSVKRDYDKKVKGYVYRLEGGASTTSTRMQLPKTDKQSLGLVQHYLVLQLLIPASARFALEVNIVDGGGSRRRILLSNSLRETSSNPLNARVPLAGVMLTGDWVNLCIDVASLVSGLFRGQVFKSLEGISLGGTCSLRRVYTLRVPPPDTTSDHTHLDGVQTEEIPRACQLPSTSLTVHTQVLNYHRLTSSESCDHSRESCDSAQGSGDIGDQRPTHVAFGSKVAIPDHILSSRQSARTNPSSRHSRTAPVIRQLSGERKDGGLEGLGLQPRPPTRPADPSLLRIQKKRVRLMNSGGRQRGQRGVPHPSSSASVKDSGYDSASISVGVAYSSDVTVTSPPKRTEDAISSQRKITSHSNEKMESDVIITSHPNMEIHGGNIERTTGDISPTELQESDSLDQSLLQEIYSFSSLPKSASAKREGGVTMDTSGRGATLEGDFLSLDNEQGSPLNSSAGSAAAVTDVHQLIQTRLSDDYDWRQYSSPDGEPMEESLRTRLATGNARGDVSTPFTVTPRSNSSELEGTLSESMTLSGWTERYRDAIRPPVFDSLDTKGMGGMLSPVVGTMEFTDNEGTKMAENGDELELMYDPQLNCFYDPITCKYYELAQ